MSTRLFLLFGLGLGTATLMVAGCSQTPAATAPVPQNPAQAANDAAAAARDNANLRTKKP